MKPSKKASPQSASQDNLGQPVYYAYCTDNCTEATAFSIGSLGGGVDFASVQLDPAGRPSVMLRMPYRSGAIFLYQCWACDGDCLNPAQWTGDGTGYTYARQVGWVEPFIHSFLADTASASVSHFATFSLATDGSGKPRLASYTGLESSQP